MNKFVSLLIVVQGLVQYQSPWLCCDAWTPMSSSKFDKLDQIRITAALAKNNNHDNADSNNNNNNGIDNNVSSPSPAGRLEELKQREAELARQLAEIRMEKLEALRSKPLTIGIVGFGRFGQFIARTFMKHGNIVVTSRTDYLDIAAGMGATYVPWSNPKAFLQQDLDVIILAVSILSFESTLREYLVPALQSYTTNSNKAPLIVDVLSVKEHPRQVMLQYLPKECDILCTHPMFGPDSGRNGWHNLNFVYEKTRVDKVVFDPNPTHHPYHHAGAASSPALASGLVVNTTAFHSNNDTFVDESGTYHSIHEDSEAHVEAMDRIERFLSIWEEEGCRMVPMSCKAHDEYAANSQFITHLMGRILGAQGLVMTPIDTKGFESVLQLVDSTTADSFDLFYGLYKYNQNSMTTIEQLKAAMDNVVDNLKRLEKKDQEDQEKQKQQQQMQPDNHHSHHNNNHIPQPTEQQQTPPSQNVFKK